MRSQRRVEHGQLHPVLSSMSRVTDGVRMVMHQMLYTSLNEQALTPDAPKYPDISSSIKSNGILLGWLPYVANCPLVYPNAL